MSCIYLHRLGCPKIEADHDTLQSWLQNENIKFVQDITKADTVIISTCAFIGDARAEAIDSILEACRWKSGTEGRRVFVTGCLPIKHEAELREEIPEVDDWFAFNRWNEMIETITSKKDGIKKLSAELNNKQPLTTSASNNIRTHKGQIVPLIEEQLSSKRRNSLPYAYLRIAEGCDRRCAYCAIPGIRGSYRSRPVQSILMEADRLINDGTREIILVAQELNSYGRDLDSGETIEQLLEKLDDRLTGTSNEMWLRLLYTHPPLYTDRFIKSLANLKSLVPYLDFPIEHADDSVLKTMGRGTTWGQMKKWIEMLRESIPELALRTSIIVGHPGEGAKEFEILCKRLEEVHFERLGVFTFSREEGTRAANLQAVDEQEAEYRKGILMNLAEEQAEAWYSTKPGCRTAMLVEEIDPNGMSIGRSKWDAPDVDGIAQCVEKAPIGEIIHGKIVSSEPYLLTIQPD
ncbi:MAG: 30S ribosomal protein S12 methylthiotransferase RimO [Candidatus Electryonea clarkiae]|nr:30S ribosomal protein S12 methylthiotransferase RimO [Candidatus Electryonea clarkiae]